MKTTMNSIFAISALFCTTLANAGVPLHLEITNGGNMPISPALIYTQIGNTALNPIGSTPSTGLVTLCQTGNPSVIQTEAQARKDISQIQTTSGLLLPGQSITVNIVAERFKSLHFVAMYGLSKDTCASFDLPFSAINRVVQGFDPEVSGKDEVIATGAYLSPRLPADIASACIDSAAAIDCLRAISAPNASGKTHYASAYLPNVLNFLTEKFGAEATEALVIPNGGAVKFVLKK